MHIFIDANIYLGFYEATSDSLIELEKLFTVLKQKQGAKLWLPDQVKREFWKNRDGSVASVLKEFAKLNGLGSIPRLVQEDPGFDQLKKLSAQLESKKKEIVDRVRAEVSEEKTKADNWIRNLFGLAEEIDTSGAIMKQAHERALRHTPPGKQDGLGDRLSWVALLTALPQKADLHIISEDGDYAGELERDEIHPHLKCEWNKKNGGNARLWKRASQFLAAHFPEAKNAIEIERTMLVERLEKSPNFTTTHAVIADFSDLSNMSRPLVTRLAAVILNNSQVHWIHGDADVRKFVGDFVARYGDVIDAVMKAELEKLL